MSVSELTSEPSALSAALWSIVKEDEVHDFPRAVQIAIKLFKTLPNLISPNAFCDMILDLKIKALIPVMSEEKRFNYAKAFSLLNSLFPVQDEDMEIKSTKYWTRHWKVRAILLQLLREDESRLVYVRDYLKYGSCGCLTRVIQRRVKEFIDVVNQHIETVAANKSKGSTDVERSVISTVSPSMITRSLQTLCTSAVETKQATHHIETRAHTKSIKQSNKRPAYTLSRCVKDFEPNCKQWRQQAPDVRSSQTTIEETSTEINKVGNESKPENTNTQHNRCKRSRLEENYKILGGIDTSSICMKEKDLSSEGKDSLNDADEDRDYNNQTAQQSEKMNSPQENTVVLGVPVLGSYSRCAMI